MDDAVLACSGVAAVHVWGRRRTEPETTARPSPNVWNWPELYEVENDAQDQDEAIWRALRGQCSWTDRDVIDLGCGDGFHLPIFAMTARSVLGIEPHPGLVDRARARTAGKGTVQVRTGTAEQLPVGSNSVDVVHARTAYFFGPGCEPGLAEVERVLRPGGALVIVDLDGARAPYGDWMRADLPHYDPGRVEAFFARRGFHSRSVDTVWSFTNRADLEAVLGIEFAPRVARRAVREVSGLVIPVGYRVRIRRKPSGGLLSDGEQWDTHVPAVTGGGTTGHRTDSEAGWAEPAAVELDT